MLQPFITPLLSRFISTRTYSVPQVKMKLKGLQFADVVEIQEAATHELKKVQKDEFLAAFQKVHDRAKACIYVNGAYFKKKKGMCLRFLKKFSPKTFGLQCV